MMKSLFLLFLCSIISAVSYSQNELIENSGAILIGPTSNPNGPFKEGTIQWNGSDFEGYTNEGWQSLTEDTPSDQYYSIPWTEFFHELSAVDYVSAVGPGPAFTTGRYFPGASNQEFTSIYATVQLPHDAIVDSMAISFIDNNQFSNLSVELLSGSHADNSSNSYGSIFSDGQSSLVRTKGSLLGGTVKIRNDQNFYLLRLVGAYSSDLTIRNVILRYTLP